MAYNEELANRVREALADQPDVEEKKMFRGISFMVNGKMCISIGDDELLCRVGPEMHVQAAEKNGVRGMMHSGRTAKGFVFVEPEGYRNPKDFDEWIRLCLAHNPFAKASKKKLKK